MNEDNNRYYNSFIVLKKLFAYAQSIAHHIKIHLNYTTQISYQFHIFPHFIRDLKFA